jgi:xanthine/uracil permease
MKKGAQSKGMRVILDVFTLVMGIGIIFAIGKGFPQFGSLLRLILLNPLGLALLAGLILAIILFRSRATRQHQDDHS